MNRSRHKVWVRLSTGLLVFAVAAVTVILWLHRRAGTRNEAERLAETEKKGREVEVAQVGHSAPEKSLVLIGETRPYYSVTLYARVSGYLTRLGADIGDAVKNGELLAQVESPETEQAYNSARADALNKKRIADRMRILLKRKLVSPQEAEQAFSASDIAEATLQTQATLRGYQRIVAPFDGQITQRFQDPGALIQNASQSQAASQPLFILSQLDRLRVFAYVDQKDAPFVHVGDPVELSLPDSAQTRREARIERIAGELDPKTRTLLTEVILENPDRKIVPGSFVQVRLKIATPSYLELPAKALVIRDKEPQVPVISKDGRIHYTKIDLAENDGEHLLIRAGVQEGEKVAINIGNSIVEGQKVQPIEQKPASQAGRKPDSVATGPPRETMTLEKCIDIALRNATQILKAQTNEYYSGEQLLQAYAQFLPDLNTSLGFSYTSGRTLVAATGFDLFDSTSRNGSFEITSRLNLFNGLADRARLKSALAQREAAVRSLDWARQQIMLDVSQSYLQVVLDRSLVDISIKNLEASQARLRLLQGQSEVGSAAIADLYRQQAQTSADELTVSNFKARAVDDELQLLRKLSIESGGAYDFVTPAKPSMKTPLASRPVEELVHDALATRNDFRSAELQASAAGWDVDRNRGDYWPHVDLVFDRLAAGRYFLSQTVNGQPTLPATQQNLLPQLGNQVVYSIGVNLTWNIFDRFVTRLNVAAAARTRENAEIDRDDVRRQVETDVRTAANDYHVAITQVESARVGLAAAEKAFESIQGRYGVGAATFIDVLTAQTALTQARSNEVEAQVTLILRDKALKYAIGKLTLQDIETEAPSGSSARNP